MCVQQIIASLAAARTLMLHETYKNVDVLRLVDE